MVARPDDTLVLALLYGLGEVLKDVAKATLRENFLPQVSGTDTSHAHWVARSTIAAFVEGKKPAVPTSQLSTHLYGLIVEGEVHSTTPRDEE